MEKLKFSVIGFGRIGQRHAKIINEFESTELISVTDTNKEQFAKINELDLDANSYASIEDFLEKDMNQSELVTIATPNGFHAKYAILLLNRGYHVLIEKPMALSVEESEAIIDAEKNSGKQVFVVKQNRYSPPSKWLKGVIDEKIIGDVLMEQTNCYWNRDERYYSTSPWRGTRDLDGGALFTQFSHFIDLLYWVFGDVKNVSAVVKNFTHPNLKDFDDSGFAQFEFMKGGIGSLNYSTSCWDQNMESSITVVGTKGSLKVSGLY